ncbi:hypothetical protein Pelo_11704 [Pelomyxa schiedti]|nr:hypothetical protein Pelo_11704 [Pelomyxa schiedti]
MHTGSIVLWNILNGTQLKSFRQTQEVTQLLPRKDDILISVGSSQITFWNLKTTEPLQILDTDKLFNFPCPAPYCVYGPDEVSFLCGFRTVGKMGNPTIKIQLKIAPFHWDIPKEGYPAGCNQMDNLLIIWASNILELWDTINWRALYSMSSWDGITCSAIAPKTRRVYYACAQNIFSWTPGCAAPHGSVAVFLNKNPQHVLSLSHTLWTLVLPKTLLLPSALGEAETPLTLLSLAEVFFPLIALITKALPPCPITTILGLTITHKLHSCGLYISSQCILGQADLKECWKLCSSKVNLSDYTLRLARNFMRDCPTGPRNVLLRSTFINAFVCGNKGWIEWLVSFSGREGLHYLHYCQNTYLASVELLEWSQSLEGKRGIE